MLLNQWAVSAGNGENGDAHLFCARTGRMSRPASQNKWVSPLSLESTAIAGNMNIAPHLRKAISYQDILALRALVAQRVAPIRYDKAAVRRCDQG